MRYKYQAEVNRAREDTDGKLRAGYSDGSPIYSIQSSQNSTFLSSPSFLLVVVPTMGKMVEAIDEKQASVILGALVIAYAYILYNIDYNTSFKTTGEERLTVQYSFKTKSFFPERPIGNGIYKDSGNYYLGKGEAKQRVEVKKDPDNESQFIAKILADGRETKIDKLAPLGSSSGLERWSTKDLHHLSTLG